MTGGKHNTLSLNKTHEKVPFGNKMRIVYTNARGTKFIKFNGNYIHVRKALKNKT